MAKLKDLTIRTTNLLALKRPINLLAILHTSIIKLNAGKFSNGQKIYKF